MRLELKADFFALTSYIQLIKLDYLFYKIFFIKQNSECWVLIIFVTIFGVTQYVLKFIYLFKMCGVIINILQNIFACMMELIHFINLVLNLALFNLLKVHLLILTLIFDPISVMLN